MTKESFLKKSSKVSYISFIEITALLTSTGFIINYLLF